MSNFTWVGFRSSGGAYSPTLNAMKLGSIGLDSTDWAARTAGDFAGQIKRFTTAGGPPAGFLCWWSASLTRWLLAHPITLGNPFANANGLAQTAEQILPGQLLVPAGLLLAARHIDHRIGIAKSGSTEAMTVNVRVGIAGTTDDIVLIGSTTLIAANASSGKTYTYGVMSATSLTREGGASPGGSYGFDSVSAPGAVTIPDAGTNPLYFSLAATMGGATNTPQSNLNQLVLTP